MRSMLAFTKKEFIGQLRGGKIIIICAVFILLGIMNPGVAKLTPWLLEVMSESMAESGMNITITTPSALDSWTQFYKNIPIGIIVFVVLEGGIFTKEYRSGTLILSLTKGLERFKVVISKSILLFSVWTIGYWMCFGITYGINALLWDNSVAKNIGFSAMCCWLFGIFMISLIVFFSTIANSSAIVLVGSGGIVIISYLISIVPKVNEYLPTLLADGTSLIYGVNEVKDYIGAVIITAIASIVCFVISVPIFNKKQL